ncbi:MAG: hypothetical protein CMJ17_09845 [Phenylobacterium sp.]|nr:hypothetical protein [Phenylobacterium sp.]
MLQLSLAEVQVVLIEQVAEVQVDIELSLAKLFVRPPITLLQSVQVVLVEQETVHLDVIQV